LWEALREKNNLKRTRRILCGELEEDNWKLKQFARVIILYSAGVKCPCNVIYPALCYGIPGIFTFYSCIFAYTPLVCYVSVAF